jgi:hypothetical protein
MEDGQGKADPTDQDAEAKAGEWAARYGEKHAWRRLEEFPPGLTPPTKVRLYRRADHFLLNWWDPGEKRNRSERVDGDLLTALTRARQVDQRVRAFKTAGAGKRVRLGHAELVSGFVADLGRRAEAGEVAPLTVDRYASALRHYLDYCERPEVSRTYPTAARVNREFRLGFAAFLSALPARGRGAGGHGFVLDAVRAMYEWGADPDRGGLLPDGFRNAFCLAAGRKPVFRGDPLAPPDITLAMALDLVAATDQFQLRLFGLILVFGLRAAEPCTLFAEHLRDGWLRVPCVPELDLLTEGRRDKTLPLIAELDPFLGVVRIRSKSRTDPGAAECGGRTRDGVASWLLASGSDCRVPPAPRNKPQVVGDGASRCERCSLEGRRLAHLRPCGRRIPRNCGSARVAAGGYGKGLATPVRDHHE